MSLKSNEQSLISSRVFPDLVLAVSDLLTGKYAQVLAELQKGLKTTEHLAFVEQLSK